MIDKRLSELSCNEYEFDKAKLLYEKSLRKIRYKTSLSYAEAEQKTSKNRSWNTIWFNPPFNQNVKHILTKSF